MAGVGPSPEAAGALTRPASSVPRAEAGHDAAIEPAEAFADGQAVVLGAPPGRSEPLPEGIVIPRPSQLHPSSETAASETIGASPAHVVTPARAAEGRLLRFRRRVLHAALLIALVLLVIGGAVLATLAVSWLLTQ